MALGQVFQNHLGIYVCDNYVDSAALDIILKQLYPDCLRPTLIVQPFQEQRYSFTLLFAYVTFSCFIFQFEFTVVIFVCICFYYSDFIVFFSYEIPENEHYHSTALSKVEIENAWAYNVLVDQV